MRILALIEDGTVVERILRHLGLWRDRPADSPARAPPEIETVRLDKDGVCLDQTVLL